MQYIALVNIQRDGYAKHEAGEVGEFPEWNEAEKARLVGEGVLGVVSGEVVQPEPEPAPAPTAFPHYVGTGDPPPGTWEYIWSHQTEE